MFGVEVDCDVYIVVGEIVQVIGDVECEFECGMGGFEMWQVWQQLVCCEVCVD